MHSCTAYKFTRLHALLKNYTEIKNALITKPVLMNILSSNTGFVTV
jgi:hypothetical protein